MKIAIESNTLKIWEALTQEKEIIKWFLRAARLKVYPGGNYEFHWGTLDKKTGKYSLTMTGKYLDVIPNEKLSFTWNSSRETATFILKPYHNGTIVCLEASGFQTVGKALESYIDESRGWTFYLINLKTYLEKKWDLRDTNPKHTLKKGFVNYYKYK
ncbi:SRPBCC domain-containing protein [Crocinitomix catalasitica]|nr:SRPBCC domain-containing protein [Crocinitomix catalasitica]